MGYTVDKLANGNVVIKNDGVNIDFSLPSTAKLSISNDGKNTVNAIFDKQPLWGFNLIDITALQIGGVAQALPGTPAALMNTLSTDFFFKVAGGAAATTLEYSPSSTYAVGDSVLVFGLLQYTNRVAVATPEVFDPAKWLLTNRDQKTGVLSQPSISVTPGEITFDILTDIIGVIADNSDLAIPLHTPVKFPATNDIPNIFNIELTSGLLVSGKKYIIKTYIATDDFTNIGAGSNATGVIFTATGTTPTDWTNSSIIVEVVGVTELLIDVTGALLQIATPNKDLVTTLGNLDLGRVINESGVSQFYAPNTITAYSSTQSFQAILTSVGGQSIVSPIVSPGSTGLTLDTTAGVLISSGRNIEVDTDIPDLPDFPARSPFPVGKVFNVWVDPDDTFQFSSAVNTIDVDNYNPTGDTLIAIPAGAGDPLVQIHRFYVFSDSDDVLIYQGRDLYNSVGEATQAINIDTFIEHRTTRNGSFAGYIITTAGETDFTDPLTFEFLPATGGISGSWGRGVPTGIPAGLTEAQKQAASTFGDFTHSATQSGFTAGVSAPIMFNTNGEFQNITHSESVDNSQFTIDIAGIYQFIIEPEYSRSGGGGTDSLNIFPQISPISGGGFVNVPNSNRRLTVSTASDDRVGTLTTTFRAEVGDIIRFMVNVSASSMELVAFAASGTPPNDIPLTPSVTLNISRIAE